MSYLKSILLHIAFSGLCCLPSVAYGQAHPMFVLKTNLLHAATTTPNLGVEMAVHPRWSLDLWGAYNQINYKGNISLRHYLIQPEARYWFRRTFKGHFVGAHLLGGEYNIGGISFISAMKEHHYKGYLAGGGFSYGYQWRFGKNWGLEVSLGAGFLTMKYDKYECRECAVLQARYKRNYFGPTRAAISLVYTLKGKSPRDVSPHLDEPELPRRSHGSGGDTYNQVFVQALASVSEATDSLRFALQQIAQENLRYRARLDSLQALQFAGRTVVPVRYEQRSSRGVMYLQYPQGGTRIQPEFEDNRRELARLDSLLYPLLADSTVTIRSIRLTGYASPEGRYDVNVNLANRRIVEVMNYLHSIYQLPDKSVFQLTAVAEDWDGLAAAIEASDKQYKKEVLRIIRTIPLFDGRELELMKLQYGNPYREMVTDFFPRLRRTEFVVEWETRYPRVVDAPNEIER